MRRKVIETLQELGFLVYQVEDFLHFEFEGKNFLLYFDDKDNDFLSIILPYLMRDEVCGVGRGDKFANLITMQLLVNNNLKYIKAFICGKSLWLSYEHEIYAQEDLEELITKMVWRLFSAGEFVGSRLEELHAMEEKKANSENNGEPSCPQDMVDFDFSLPEDIFDIEVSENENHKDNKN